MKPLPRSKAKDVFSHLLAIVTLYVGVVSFVALYFQYINVKFPDAVQYSTGELDIIRQSMAGLIVVWPVYILISWLINKDLKTLPEKVEVGIRKWLLYLTLFVTSVTMIIDLVTLVKYFLDGEITTRFILKVLVILVTDAAVFGYYLWDLRREVRDASPVLKATAAGSSFVMIATIILGFIFVGSPAQQRQVRFDDQRVNNLMSIQQEVISYYGQKGELPGSLDGLNSSLTSFFVAPVDPDTGRTYDYVVKDKLSFQLCANFSTSSNGDSTQTVPVKPYGYDSPYGQNWNHEAGRVCFDRTIDPSMFPDKALKNPTDRIAPPVQ